MLLSLIQWASAQSVTPNKVNYEKGVDVSIAFSGGPGNSADWVGVYPQGGVPDGSLAATLWAYTNGTQSSGGNLTAGNVTFSNPTLAAGNYSAWFLANDGYTAIAGPTHFTIAAAPATDPPAWILASFKRRHAVIGNAYSGKISAYTNFKGYTFSKVMGPAWLTVAVSGELSGTPPAGSTGLNLFTVRASNGTDTADASMSIEVFAPNTEVVREVKVMSYNAWHGWGQINNGHRKGLESIIFSGADIIGMQESTDNVSGSRVYQPQKIADDLGWFYRSNISGSIGLISRYPISDQTLAAGLARGFKVKITSSPLQEAILMNCHLDYTDYGPYAAQITGATEASVLVVEKTSDRDEQIAAIMTGMNTILNDADNIPVFLTGDFNAPSHLDWTPATSSEHGGVGNVAWPTSNTVVNAGMTDSFRVVNTNPVTVAGNTWSPVFKSTEPQDRIDFVYYKGASVTPVKSLVYTTAVENTVGAWGASTTPLMNNTWPSDHAAVITIFRLKLVDADADGLSDAYENLNFGDTNSQAGDNDADLDGSTNAAEQSHGTDPNNAASVPSTSLKMPAAPQTTPSVSFNLSSMAIDGGLVCERSTDLSGWGLVWSYQADPNLESSLITLSEIDTGKWNVTVEDTTVDLDKLARVFYRVRLGN